MKRIVITGATGVLGRALLNKCISNNTEAYVLVRPDSPRVDSIPDNPLIHIVFCSMEKLKSFDASKLEACDVFYHFAWAATHGTARNDVGAQVRNIQYTLDAVQLAARMKCKRFIGAGSQAEYGRVEGVLRPETPCFPENGYGMAKLCAGQMSRLECQKLGLEHVWGRIVSLYGPGDGMDTMVSMAIRTCLSGENPQFTKGDQLWDYLYSEDAGDAFYRLGVSGKKDEIYVIGSGKVQPLRTYIKEICKAVNPEVVPLFGAFPYAEKQVMHLQADIGKLMADTGFEPVTEFAEGIAATVHWLKTKNESTQRKNEK